MIDEMTSAPADRELIQRLCDGDLNALGTLYDRYRLLVFHTALAITRDRQAAEDILQECFLKVNSYARRIDVNLPLEPWLYRVTVNLAYTYVTRRSRWLTSLESVIDRLVSPARTNSEYHAEMSELQAVIQQAIDELQPTQRMTVILYYLNDLSLKEISYILDCPVGTVKSRLYYGREHLKRQLEEYLKPRHEPVVAKRRPASVG
ncbi:MAG TPA: RNA polymerase sigma factor [Anaerolineae bacterium]|nr:RNA polymerase sigma factor [Anaerolineae bacterium]